ncbi:hypothetical protein HAX54_052830, partial [Datura stramonium]|nr:hypothetical protein [Datura stramonium]
MESKGKEVVTANPSFKRFQKGTKGASSSAVKAGPTRRFGVKFVEPHGLTWFNTQKEAKYALENWINEAALHLSSRPSGTRSKSWKLDTSLLSERSASSH